MIDMTSVTTSKLDAQGQLAERILKLVSKVPIAEAFETTLKLYREEQSQRGRLALMTARLALIKLVLEHNDQARKSKSEEPEQAQEPQDVSVVEFDAPVKKAPKPIEVDVEELELLMNSGMAQLAAFDFSDDD